MSALSLNFNNLPLSPVNHNNQIWLTSVDLANALGYSRTDKISQIYDRNKDEFNDNMSTVLRSPQIEGLGESSGLQREQRIFSLRGCHLLAMFSRTAIAKEFRKWVLDILDHQTKPQYGLKELPPSPHISESEASQFKKSIEALCGGDRKRYSELYRKIYDYYEITGYKNIPAGKLEEAARLIGMKLLPLRKPKMPVEPFTLTFTPEELEDLVVERIKAFEGELLPRQEAPQHNSITINLAPLNADRRHRRWLVTQLMDEMTVLDSLNPDQQLKTREQFIKDLIAEGYIVMKKEDVLDKLIN
jgi:hypothetical protein